MGDEHVGERVEDLTISQVWRWQLHEDVQQLCYAMQFSKKRIAMVSEARVKLQARLADFAARTGVPVQRFS